MIKHALRVAVVILMLAAHRGGAPLAVFAGEADGLAGTWKGQVNSAKGTSDEVTVKITADDIAISRKGSTTTRPFTLDTSKNPKWIDLKSSAKDAKAPPVLGVYQLKGDVLKICVGTTKRPTSVDGGKGVAAVYVLRRVKP